jgi:hypothetical protein
VIEIFLEPGHHVLQLGEHRHPLTAVAENSPTAGGSADSNASAASSPPDLLRCHPMKPLPASCESCHRGTPARSAGGWPSVPTPEACVSCHEMVRLEAIHAHPMEHLHHCQDCHHMHAAPKKHLLTKPPRELCNACHAA